MSERQTSATAAPVANDWGSRSHVQTLVLMAGTGFGIYLCFRLAMPFLPALVWALALAVVCTPCQRWVESRVKPEPGGGMTAESSPRVPGRESAALPSAVGLHPVAAGSPGAYAEPR